MKEKENEQFEAAQMYWIGTINQKPTIRINSISDIVLISQTINGQERTIFLDEHFIELFTKTLLNYKFSRHGNNK